MKCDICGKKIELTVLDKIKGTYFVEGKKKFIICPDCQKKGDDFIRKRLKI